MGEPEGEALEEGFVGFEEGLGGGGALEDQCFHIRISLKFIQGISVFHDIVGLIFGIKAIFSDVVDRQGGGLFAIVTPSDGSMVFAKD